MSRRPTTPDGLAAGVVTAAVVVSALVFWRGLAEPFQLPKLALGVTLALVAAGTWVVDAVRRARLVLPTRGVLLAVAGFLVALVVCVVASRTPMASVFGTYTFRSGLLTYGAGVLLLLVAAATFDEERALRLLLWATGAAGAVALYVLVQKAGADPFTWLRGQSVFGTFGNPDLAAGWLAISLPLATGVALLLPTWDWRRVGAVAVAVGSAVALALVPSFQGLPTGAAGLVVVLGAWSLSDAERRSRIAPLFAGTGRKVVLAGGVVVVGAVVLAVSWSELRHGLVERRYFWQAALDVWSRHPVAGSGLDTFATEFFHARPTGHAVRYPFSSAEAPHDVPLAMLANGGLLLAVTYLAVVVTVGVALVRGLARADGAKRVLLGAVAGAWLGYQVQSLVSIDVPALVFAHWALAGVGVALSVPEDRLVYVGRAARTRKGGAYQVVRTGVVGGLVVAVLVVAGVVTAFRPLVADRDAVRAVDLSRAGTNPTKVVAELRAAVRLAPWEPTYRLAQASLFQQLGNPPEAVKAVMAAAERDPGRPQYRLAAGDLLASTGQKEEAIVQYEKALDLDPDNVQVLSRAGIALAQLGREKDGIGALQHAVDLQPGAAGPFVDLATGLRAAGRDDEADDAFAKAVELDPSLKPPGT